MLKIGIIFFIIQMVVFQVESQPTKKTEIELFIRNDSLLIDKYKLNDSDKVRIYELWTQMINCNKSMRDFPNGIERKDCGSFPTNEEFNIYPEITEKIITFCFSNEGQWSVDKYDKTIKYLMDLRFRTTLKDSICLALVTREQRINVHFFSENQVLNLPDKILSELGKIKYLKVEDLELYEILKANKTEKYKDEVINLLTKYGIILEDYELDNLKFSEFYNNKRDFVNDKFTKQELVAYFYNDPEAGKGVDWK